MTADREDPWEILDAEHGELEALYTAVFEPGGSGVKPRVLEIAGLSASPAKLIALHTLRIEEPFRGRQLGIHFARSLIETFGDDSSLLLLPYPTEAEDEERYQVKRAQRALSAYWQEMGLKPIPGSDWLVSACSLRSRRG